MKLHWHRWVTRRGTSYYLQLEPWNGDTASRLLGTELAAVYRRPSDGRWLYDVKQHGTMPATWGVVGAPNRARRLAEEYIDRKSIAAFEDDRLEIVPC